MANEDAGIRGAFLRRGWRGVPVVLLLVVLPLLGGAVGLVVAALTPPRYTAHAYVLITARDQAGGVSGADIAQAVARVATTESVLVSGGSAGDLLRAAREDRLTASTSPDAPLVEVSATASRAPEAAALANRLARQVQGQVSNISEVAGVRATLLASASTPSERASPNLLVNLAAGVALGVLAAAVLYILRQR